MSEEVKNRVKKGLIPNRIKYLNKNILVTTLDGSVE